MRLTIVLAASLVLSVASSTRAGADEWSGVVEAYAAYASDSCARAEEVLAKCKHCDEPGPAAYVALLRAFCRERSGAADASSFYQELVTRYPNSDVAEQAMLRVVTIARTQPEPPPPGPPPPGSMENMPRFRPSPGYPEILRRARIAGRVLLGFDVRPDGRVADAHVIESTPPYLFDLAAMNSLIRWYYPPHERRGLRVRLSFDLAN